KDTDGDLAPDYVENKDGTDPNDPTSYKDSDGGGVPDYVETVLYPNLGLPIGDPNNRLDDQRDTDNGGVSDYEELKLGTDPLNSDDDQAAQPTRVIWLPLVHDHHNDCATTMTCQ
ncbi:MAG: hypothetical protein DCC55_17830, partial [Chloroflexi bacterium]